MRSLCALRFQELTAAFYCGVTARLLGIPHLRPDMSFCLIRTIKSVSGFSTFPPALSTAVCGVSCETVCMACVCVVCAHVRCMQNGCQREIAGVLFYPVHLFIPLRQGLPLNLELPISSHLAIPSLLPWLVARPWHSLAPPLPTPATRAGVTGLQTTLNFLRACWGSKIQSLGL